MPDGQGGAPSPSGYRFFVRVLGRYKVSGATPIGFIKSSSVELFQVY